MDDYKRYLGTALRSDGEIVTYRTLSRVLKVHVDDAKEMLSKFYEAECAKEPGSLHAVYLVAGTKSSDLHPKEIGDDISMDGSPAPSSWEAPSQRDVQIGIPMQTVGLVREEDLEVYKKQFEEISCIHMYSLQPGRLKDIEMIATANAQIPKLTAGEDPLQAWKTYGSIRNEQVRRRSPKVRPPAPKAPDPPKVKPEAQHQAPKPQGPTHTTSDKLKGKAKNDIFTSFAKAKATSKNPQPPQRTPSPKQDVDTTMKDVFDEDDDDSDDFAPIQNTKPIQEQAAARKARLEREAKLRKMMDEDEDGDEDGDVKMTDSGGVSHASPDEEIEEPEIDEQPKDPIPEPKESVTVSDGRRRGRRKVTKKKTTQDADGYLVTTEQTMWESFSEEEPQPVKKNPVQAPMPSKGKKGASAGKGQAGIMSFFAKKP